MVMSSVIILAMEAVGSGRAAFSSNSTCLVDGLEHVRGGVALAGGVDRGALRLARSLLGLGEKRCRAVRGHQRATRNAFLNSFIK